MQPQTGHLEFNDGEIYYEVTGQGEPIVFIHGFTLDHRMWQPQVEFFSRRFRTIVYDARGYGRSSLPTGPYNHHDDLHALLAHLHVGSAHVVGLSMGGRIAVNFALEYPRQVRTLALLDAALDGYKNTVDWNVYATATVRGLAKAKANWMAHGLFSGTRQHPQVMAALRPIIDDYSGWHWLNRDPQSPHSTHARKRLSEIQARTLVVVGEQDLTYFHNIADTLATGIPSAHKETVPDAGHMVNMEAPGKVDELLETNFRSRIEK